MVGTIGRCGLILAASVLLACPPRVLPDGATCVKGQQCASGPCQLVGVDCSSGNCREHGYCGGSQCSDSGDCEANWECRQVKTHEGSFLEILDKDKYDYLCSPKCDPCPELMSCGAESLCYYDSDWTAPDAPLVTIDAPYQLGAGEPATLTVTATSPTDADIVSYLWYFHGGGEAMGASIEHVFTAEETLEHDMMRRFFATVEVADAQGITTTRTAEIARCGVAGEACDAMDCCSELSCAAGSPTPVCQ